MSRNHKKERASSVDKAERKQQKKAEKAARDKLQQQRKQESRTKRAKRKQKKAQSIRHKKQLAKKTVANFFGGFCRFAQGQLHYFHEKQRLTLKKKDAESQLDYLVEHAAKNDDLLAGRLAYDQLYGKQNEQVKRQSKMIYILGFTVVVSVLLLFILGSESKIDPVIVKIDGNNQVLDIEQAAHVDYSKIEPEIYTYWILQFIKNARSISVDGQLESTMVKGAYAFTQGAATKTMRNFFLSRDPYNTASNEVVTIQVNTVIPNVGGSSKTTQVEWTEIAKDPKTGQLLSQYQYTGQFTFSQSKKPPKNKEIALYNPLGFYITAISWSQNYTNNPV